MDISTASVVSQSVHDSAVVLAFGAMLTAGLTALIKIATLVLAGYAGRLINTKLNVENSTWKQKIAFRLVCYAENKILGDTAKQNYVSGQLAKLLGDRVDQDEIQHLLEEAYTELQAKQKGVPVP